MKLNVGFSSDNNYAKQLGITILSLLENNRIMDEICIYVIDNGIDEKNKKIINKIVESYDRKIYFLEFKKLCQGLKTDNTFSISSFGRIFLSRIEEVDVIIYMDCDAIVCDSLEELIKIDMTNYYVAGVQDNVSPFYKESIGMKKDDKYINAGFLLMNLKKWREDEIEKKCLKFIERYNGSVPHHDQGTINGVCKEKILFLHPKYNVQSPMFDIDVETAKKYAIGMQKYYTQQEINEAIKNPVFIHYTAGFYNRPWNKNCTHPFKDKYLYYMNKTIWKNELENGKLNKKVQIMKGLYKILPYKYYYLINQIISNQKEKKLRKK